MSVGLVTLNNSDKEILKTKELLKTKGLIDIYYNKPTKKAGSMAAQAPIGEEEPVPVSTIEPSPRPKPQIMNERMTALDRKLES